MIPKLSVACYAARLMVHTRNNNTLKSIYYAYFHSIIKYGIIYLQEKSSELCLVNNPEPHVEVCLNNYEILPVPSQYIFSLINFVTNNPEIFQTNSSLHNINTRNTHHLHRPNANISCFQKSTFYAGIKIFSNLTPGVTILKNDKAKFKAALGKYLNTHSVYSLDEYLVCNADLKKIKKHKTHACFTTFSTKLVHQILCTHDHG
jgi:hypothetical protein